MSYYLLLFNLLPAQRRPGQPRQLYQRHLALFKRIQRSAPDLETDRERNPAPIRRPGEAVQPPVALHQHFPVAAIRADQDELVAVTRLPIEKRQYAR